MDNKKILQLIEKGINEAIKEASKKMLKKYTSVIYSRQTSGYYDRTQQLENALSNPPYVKISSEGKVNIQFLDLSILKAKKISNPYFNEHMSFKGKSSTTSVLYYQDAGYDIPRNHKHIAGIGFIDYAFEGMKWDDWLADKTIDNIADELFIEIQRILQKGGE